MPFDKRAFVMVKSGVKNLLVGDHLSERSRRVTCNLDGIAAGGGREALSQQNNRNLRTCREGCDGVPIMEITLPFFELNFSRILANAWHMGETQVTSRPSPKLYMVSTLSLWSVGRGELLETPKQFKDVFRPRPGNPRWRYEISPSVMIFVPIILVEFNSIPCFANTWIIFPPLSCSTRSTSDMTLERSSTS